MPAPNLPRVDPQLLAVLPPVLRAVVRALGVARAREWLMQYGGQHAIIPLICTSKGLSKEEVARLRRELARHMDAAGRVTIPKADKVLIWFRDQQIRNERGRYSLPTLAHRYNLTVRHVMNICREDGDAGQGSLSLF
jgi:Mor family transcriptional regulator